MPLPPNFIDYASMPHRLPSRIIVPGPTFVEPERAIIKWNERP